MFRDFIKDRIGPAFRPTHCWGDSAVSFGIPWLLNQNLCFAEKGNSYDSEHSLVSLHSGKDCWVCKLRTHTERNFRHGFVEFGTPKRCFAHLPAVGILFRTLLYRIVLHFVPECCFFFAHELEGGSVVARMADAAEHDANLVHQASNLMDIAADSEVLRGTMPKSMKCVHAHAITLMVSVKVHVKGNV